MLGGPQPMYNEGLLDTTLRDFDPERRRPGLPPDVAVAVNNRFFEVWLPAGMGVTLDMKKMKRCASRFFSHGVQQKAASSGITEFPHSR